MATQKLPFNVYVDNLINPDGSRIEGSGRPLSSRMNIDPSKIQKAPVPWNKPTPPRLSPWLNSPTEISGGSYPSGFINDGVGANTIGTDFTIVPEGTNVPAVIDNSKPYQPRYLNSGFVNDGVGKRPDGINFTMPDENARTPVKYVAQPEVMPGNGNGGNNRSPTVPKDIVGERGKDLVNIAQLMSKLTPIGAGISSYIPDPANAGDQLVFENKIVNNRPMDYQKNSVRELANSSFNDPMLASMMAYKPAQQAMPINTDSEKTEVGSNDNESAEPSAPVSSNQISMSRPNTMSSPLSHKPIMVRGNGLDNMIAANTQASKDIAGGRDQDLLRLLGMRDNVTESLANKSTFDRMDLSPLNAFVDSMYGSKLAGGYNVPDSGMKDVAAVQGLNDKITAYNKAKNDEKLAWAKALMENQYKNENMGLKSDLGFARLENKLNNNPLQTWMMKEEYKRQHGQEKQPNGDQSKAATFASRMDQAEGDLSGAMKRIDRTGIKGAILSSSIMPEVFTPESAKLMRQAEKNFVTAQLRRESGAAISNSEFKTAEAQYFPRVGDTPDVLAQKQKNREIAIAGMKAEAGDTALNRVSQRMSSEIKPTAGKVDYKSRLDAINAALRSSENK